MTVEIGTATDSFDLLSKLRTFLTATLPVNERWEELSYYADYNHMVSSTAAHVPASAANIFDGDPISTWGSGTGVTSSSVTWSYNRPAALDTVAVRYGLAATINSAPKNFTLQYSDDNLSYTTAYTSPTLAAADYANDATFTFAVSAGAHPYWRLAMTSTIGGTTPISLSGITPYKDGRNMNEQLQRHLALRGQGGGTDNIYVTINTRYDASGDYYNWQLYGHSSYQEQHKHTPQSQPGALTDPPTLLLWNGSIPYWFVANGRRFIVVAKINTTYHVMYAGFILPYATPNQYNYPLVIGGSCCETTYRWSDTTARTRNFYDAGCGGLDPSTNSSCLLRLPDGSWQGFANWYQSSGDAAVYTYRMMWPYWNHGNSDIWSRMRENIDGSYTLFPIMLHSRTPTPSSNIYGEFDGVFAVSGFNSGAENTVTIDSVPHLVIPNVYRTAKHQWAAIRLE